MFDCFSSIAMVSLQLVRGQATTAKAAAAYLICICVKLRGRRIASAITQVLRQSKKPYPIYELAGPRVYSYEELVRAIASTAELRPVLMRTPFAFWDAAAGLAELLPRPPLTRNQVELMQIDTTASGNLPGFRELGISPRSLEEELKAILKQSK